MNELKLGWASRDVSTTKPVNIPGQFHMRISQGIIDPVTVAEPIHVLIVVPPFSISTPAVYRAWDELAGPRSTRSISAPRDYSRWRQLSSVRTEPSASNWATNRSPASASRGGRCSMHGSHGRTLSTPLQRRSFCRS